MDPWRTGIVNADDTQIWIRGHEIGGLMRQSGFVETIFLLHTRRLPSSGERRLLDAILVGVADHGPGAPSCAAARLVASGNRQSVSAAIAAGVLAIGDEHGGAGEGCMALIDAQRLDANAEPHVVDEAARRAVEHARDHHRRLPGLGHRTHTTDPRVAVLFELANEVGVAGAGVRFMLALEQAAATAIKPLPINIDGALAAVLHDLGFPPAAAKLIFIIGRVAGITAEVAEEYERERVMRIRIPVVYDGETPRQREDRN
jgi:citrate synthase